uniref:Nebulin n=1 Tax=Paramormyrops kingsleyae TaxID=1676925 RepID=A0A3B3QDB1_9TELE
MQIQYKKSHDEQLAQFTSLANPPEVDLAKKVFAQRSDVSVPPSSCLSACDNHLHQNTAQHSYSTLLGQERPRNMLAVYSSSNCLSMQAKVYKADYEKARGFSINYCDTPKFKMDNIMKNRNQHAHYKDKYENEVKGHYVGSYEDMNMMHCQRVEEIKGDKNYKADYEDTKNRCFYLQTMTPEYEAVKKLQQCSDKVYKQHPDRVKFTQVTDSPVQVQAAINAKQLSDVRVQEGHTIILEFCAYPCLCVCLQLHYKEKYEKEKFKCYVPPDYPFFIQSRVNAYNLSDNCYKYDWEKTKAKKFEMKSDALPILAARAHTNIISDVKYKKQHEKDKGQMIGALSIEDDPKILHSVHVAKIQSDREYKKNYEKTKTKYHTPLDMMAISQAKKSQAVASNTGYKNLIHKYFLPSDSMALDLAKRANTIQSDNDYKSEYNCYTKGTPWVPFGSLDVEKAKMAGKALDEKNYRQHPDTIKFTSICDSPVMVQAKLNAQQLSDRVYKASGEKFLHTYNLPVDSPELLQAKYNAANFSPVSEQFYKYKKDYEKSRGHHLGYRSLQDDPLLVHYMKVAKMQSDKNYKKDYHKTKLKYSSPVDMLSVVQAKQASAATTNIGYKKLQHRYTLLPDAMDLELARSMMGIQSDNAYKADYNSMLRGASWVPIGSLDVEKAKAASRALDEKSYRQHPSMFSFTSLVDSVNMALATSNTKASGEKFKHTYNLPVDSPEFIQAKYNAVNLSEVSKAQGHSSIVSKDYEKSRGHHLGYRSLQDDPLLVHYMMVAKMQSDKNYKKDYHKTKLKYSSPVDMLSIVQAKQASAATTNIGYKKLQHRYTLLPDAMDLELCNYKNDYNNYMKGTGWVPIGSLAVETARVGTEIQSEKRYRTHPSKFQFTKLMDSMDLALATANNQTMNQKAYTDAWEKDKLKVHIMPDSPLMIQAKINQLNMSEKLYKAGMEEVKRKGYDLQLDAISIKAAKSSRDIASDYKYKQAYEKSRGHHLGYRSLQDDPLLVHYMEVAKLQSDKNYKKDYHKTKLKYSSPVDMLSVVQAKQASAATTNIGYKKLQHRYTLLPDAMDLELARSMNSIVSNVSEKLNSDFSLLLRVQRTKSLWTIIVFLRIFLFYYYYYY